MNEIKNIMFIECAPRYERGREFMVLEKVSGQYGGLIQWTEPTKGYSYAPFGPGLAAFGSGTNALSSNTLKEIAAFLDSLPACDDGGNTYEYCISSVPGEEPAYEQCDTCLHCNSDSDRCRMCKSAIGYQGYQPAQ